jgi:TPR repeat protein
MHRPYHAVCRRSENARSSWRYLINITLAAFFLAVQTLGIVAQTNEELRALYDRKDFARIEELAKGGHPRAEFYMALIAGSRRQTAEAMEWYRRAAEKDDIRAMENLALMAWGNDAERVKWYRRGAELGDGTSQINYAAYLLLGQGIARNEQEAFRWYLAAARPYGRIEAYLAVAELYAAGTGTPRDPLEASAYLEIALKTLSRSDIPDENKLRALEKQLADELSPQQRAQAHARAHELRPDLIEK